MKRFATRLTVLAVTACFVPGLATAAQTHAAAPIKATSAKGHKARMRHDQLTLYPHGRPARHKPNYDTSRHRFDQPSPIHNTFMGVQRW